MNRQRLTVITGGKFSPDILRQVAADAGGYTVYYHTGGWLDDDHNLIQEAGQTLVVFIPNRNMTTKLIYRLKDDATKRGELCIIVERSDSDWRLT